MKDRRVKISRNSLQLALIAGFFSAQSSAQPAGRFCYPQTESINAVVTNRLMRPFAALRAARIATGADPVAAKLCRWREEFVYEVVLLHRDGRVANVFVDAVTGAFVRPGPN